MDVGEAAGSGESVTVAGKGMEVGGGRALERVAASVAGNGVGVAGVGLEGKGEGGGGLPAVAIAGVGGGGTTVARTATNEKRTGGLEGGNRRIHCGLGQNRARAFYGRRSRVGRIGKCHGLFSADVRSINVAGPRELCAFAFWKGMYYGLGDLSYLTF